MTLFMSPDASVALSMPGTSRPIAVVWPPKPLAMALVTVSRSVPVAADTSMATFMASCDLVTSPVARMRLPSAGRSSSSATPVAADVLLIQSSVDLICASVASAVFFIVLARIAWDFSSSAAARPADTAAPPSANSPTVATLLACPMPFLNRSELDAVLSSAADAWVASAVILTASSTTLLMS